MSTFLHRHTHKEGASFEKLVLWKAGDVVKRNVEGPLFLSADSRVRMAHGSGDLVTQ